jgi:hypothetical protein
MSVTVQVTTNPITVLPVSEVVDATYTFVLADRLKVTAGNRPTAQTFTVPAAADVDFPDGALINGFQAGDGQVSIVGDGFTINTVGGANKTRVRNAPFVLWHRTGDEWWLWGDVIA